MIKKGDYGGYAFFSWEHLLWFFFIVPFLPLFMEDVLFPRYGNALFAMASKHIIKAANDRNCSVEAMFLLSSPFGASGLHMNHIFRYGRLLALECSLLPKAL